MISSRLLQSCGLLFCWVLFVFAHSQFVAMYLYWEIWWLDLLMHFLGGGLFVMSWYYIYSLGTFRSYLGRIGAICGLTVVIVGWEVFKYVIGSTVHEGYVFDTVTDIIIGLSGGLSAKWTVLSFRIKT